MGKTRPGKIENVMPLEEEIYKPIKEFKQEAHVDSFRMYKELYDNSINKPEKFWSDYAKEFHWFKKWDKVLDGKFPEIDWFKNGTTNISYNCLDRHVQTWKKNKAALIWEGEPGEVRVITYQMLFDQVCRFSNVLLRFGVKKGDVVTLHMGMIPELVIAMLACARIGAVHSVIYSGFAGDSLIERINDSGSEIIVTSNTAVRKGEVIPLKSNIDNVISKCTKVKNILVYNRLNDVTTTMQEERDFWWHDEIEKANDRLDATEIESSDPLFILYTSSIEGKPIGVVHSTGGYMVQCGLTSRWVYDLKEGDIYWCASDIAWISGHSYVVYGPLLMGATVFLYEGAPDQPEKDRFWKIISKHKVTIFHTVPSVLRSFISWGNRLVNKYDLSSLRLLGVLGETIKAETWKWFFDVIGKGKTPIVNTFCQTETGAILLSPLAGATPSKPGSCGFPLPGVKAAVVDIEGKPLSKGEAGYLLITTPFPSMFRGIYNDKKLTNELYWNKFKNDYFTRDAAFIDKDGYIRILGRVDDMIKIAGYRLSNAEIELALKSHEYVNDAVVVPRYEEIKGNSIIALVKLNEGIEESLLLKEELRSYIVQKLGLMPKPDEIRIVDSLPEDGKDKDRYTAVREMLRQEKPASKYFRSEEYKMLEKLRKEFALS